MKLRGYTEIAGSTYPVYYSDPLLVFGVPMDRKNPNQNRQLSEIDQRLSLVEQKVDRLCNDRKNE